MTTNMDRMRSTPEGYAWSRFGEQEYTDWIDESMSWKETCYIGDWSFLWQRWFKGPDTLRLFSDISVNNFDKFEIGQGKHAIHCNNAGNIIHEGILTRFGQDEYMLHGRGGFWADYVLRHGDYDVSSEADDWFIYQVSGPTSVAVIEKAAGESMRDIGFMRLRQIEINGIKIWALRQGMAGEIGFELQGPAQYGPEIYDAVFEAGKEFGIRKLGARAAVINHLEACFPTIVTDYLPAIFDEDMEAYLQELKSAMPPFASSFSVAGSFESDDVASYYRNPVELGWQNRINFGHDFIGRDALRVEVENPRRTMRTLVWDSDDVVDVYASLFGEGQPYDYMDMPRDQRGRMWADKVLGEGQLVGISTSRGYSYYFREMLSLCTIDVEFSEPGTEVTVVWGNPGRPQKEIRARVAPAPYKEDRRRLDLKSV